MAIRRRKMMEREDLEGKGARDVYEEFQGMGMKDRELYSFSVFISLNKILSTTKLLQGRSFIMSSDGPRRPEKHN